MKLFLMISVLGLPLLAAQGAGSLNSADVDAAMVPCIFDVGCSNTSVDSFSPITLKGTTGAGFLQSRVSRGATNSAGAGLFGYEYRVDLAGIITASNHPACLTNVIRCSTNVFEKHTNQLVCRTNIIGVITAVTCFTNQLPPTNIVVCLTNAIPGTNITQCYSNSSGAVCFTNVFPPTNVVLWITNRVPARTIISCQTNLVDPGHPIVFCYTNRVKYLVTNVTCRTNLQVCPGAPPCINYVRIKVGKVTPFDFNRDGTNDDVYVVATGGMGTVRPSSIERDGKNLTVRFSPPLCAGQGSLAVGFLSTKPPRDVDAQVKLTTGDTKSTARAPGGGGLAKCKFEDLAGEIDDLNTSDFLGANDAEREARRTMLLANVQAAKQAAQVEDLDGVLNALAQVIIRVDGGTNDWLTTDAAHDVNDKIKDLLDCLEENSGRDIDEDDLSGQNDNDDDDKQ